jgi:hypothetical protein
MLQLQEENNKVLNKFDIIRQKGQKRTKINLKISTLL